MFSTERCFEPGTDEVEILLADLTHDLTDVPGFEPPDAATETTSGLHEARLLGVVRAQVLRLLLNHGLIRDDQATTRIRTRRPRFVA
jgi:hypothetical protein